MNDRQQKMGSFLANAAKVIARTEQIAPTAKKYIPSMAESAAIDGIVTGDYGNYEQNYVPQTYAPAPSYGGGGYSPASTKLPKSILESITAQPIQDYQSSMGGIGMDGMSVLDNILPPPNQRQAPRQQMNEDYGEKQMPTYEDLARRRRERLGEGGDYQQPAYQAPINNIGGIDYSLIKLMIEDAIAEEFKSLKKSLLTEGKNSDGANNLIVKVGSDIQFMTNKGNIYTGKLKFSGNVKDI